MPITALLLLSGIVSVSSQCLGEYAVCPSGECSLGPCGLCPATQYLCPDQKTCVADAKSYESCPGLKGTHFDWTLSVDERVDYLVATTTLNEKVSQLTNDAPAITRLGIPSYNWLNDDIHDVKNSTDFPNPCGLGASWSRRVLSLVGDTIGQEARGRHNVLIHGGDRTPHGMYQNNGNGITTYAPNINQVRDPRWGRNQETYGEDPFLVGQLAVALVRAMQNRSADGKQMRTGSCCKHYGVHDVEDGRMSFNSKVDTRNLWETFLPAFHACTVTANASSVMCSYNAVNGVPSCGNPDLLNGVLRKRWNWDGFVVSDYDALANIYDYFKYVDSPAAAASTALNAGCDQEGGFQGYYLTLNDSVANGTVPAEVIAAAFRRLFKTRVQLGMFDPPAKSPYSEIPPSVHVSLARDVARQSICLYKNERQALPLDISKLESIAVIGPSSIGRHLLLGKGLNQPGGTVPTIMEAITSVMNTTGATVYWEAGCVGYDESNPSSALCNESDLHVGYAKAAAVKADATVVVIGLDNWWECEGRDRKFVELPGAQEALVANLSEALRPLNKPLIVVLIHGGSIALRSVVSNADAILDGWYPGMEGAHAIADVLFGQYNPGGKTAATWYQSTDQLGDMTNMDLYSGNGTTYRHFTGDVLFPFGFGLSYTTFAYSALSMNVTTSNVDPCTWIGVTVTVTNTGSRAGDEVVQVYVRQLGATVPVPRIRLVSFDRVENLQPGKSQTVTLGIDPVFHTSVMHNDGNIWDPTILVESGLLEISVGGGQPGYTAGVLQQQVTIAYSKDITKC